jgi:AcrR family transcriptional regulator
MLREKILRSAMDLFGQNGFERVSVNEVAAQAGVGKGSVYRQFASKEQLYATAVIQGFIELRSQIHVALEIATSVPDRIATLVRHALSYFWNRPEFFLLLRDPSKLPRSQENRYRTERRKLSVLITGVLNDGAKAHLIRDDLNFELLAESLLGMMRGINRYRRENVSFEEAARTVVSLFLDGCSRTRRPE